MARGRVALEVLFWLPEEFMREYQDLFMRALKLGDGDGGEKAGADEGRILEGKGKGVGKETSRTKLGREVDEVDESGEKTGKKIRVSGSQRGAQGGGKKYKVDWIVKDEQALAIKARVDRELVGLIGKMAGREARNGGTSGSTDQTRGGRAVTGLGGGKLVEGEGGTRGSTPGVAGRRLVAGTGGGKRCEGCGKIASSDWVMCPRPHA